MNLHRLLYPYLFSPADDAGALAAVNAALEGQVTPPGDGNADASAGAGGEGGEADAEGGTGAGGDGAGAGAGDGAEGEPTAEELAAAETAAEAANAAAGDGEAAGDPPVGHERDAKGRFVKKAAADPAAAAAAAKGAKPEIDPATGKPKAAAAPKKGDPVNDPIPDDVKGRTRERMEGLVTAAKALTTERDALKAEVEGAREFLDMIDATGATPESFGAHMNVLALMHSTNVDDKRAVLGYLNKARDKIAGELGETVGDADPLAGHQDLIDDVEGGELRKERAIEIATARNRQKAADNLRTAETTRNNEQSAVERQKAATKTALNGLTAELRKKDGDALYDRKHKLLVPIVKRMVATLPADKVVAAVREAYAAIELAPVVPVNNGGRAPAGTGAQQPQRHRQGASGGAIKEAKSGLEALELGLQEHARAGGRA
jgi:hypothetical protein